MCFNQMASKLSKCDSTRQSEMFLNVILDVFKCVKDIHLRCLSLLSVWTQNHEADAVQICGKFWDTLRGSKSKG